MVIVVSPPAPQGAVPRTHQAHQDQLAISLAEPTLKAGHWNPRPAASGSLGLVYFFRSPVHARASAPSRSAKYIPCAAIAIGLRPARLVLGRLPLPTPGQARVRVLAWVCGIIISLSLSSTSSNSSTRSRSSYSSSRYLVVSSFLKMIREPPY